MICMCAAGRRSNRPYVSTRMSYLCCLLVAWLATAQTADALPIGGIVNVKPQVSARADQKAATAWKVVGERYQLSYGEFLRTDKTGKADILFNNGTDIVLRGNTQIQIVAPATAEQPLIVRVFGALSEIFVRAKGKTEIRSAACNAAVRGTEFLFRLPADDRAELTVLEGAVAFYNAKGQVLVTANQQSSARIGEAPAPPTAVDVTGMITWTADVTGLPVEFETRMTELSPAELDNQRRVSEAAVQANPQDVEAHRRLGCICFDRGAFADARREFTEVTRLAPADAAGFISLGITAGNSGDHQAALAAFQRAEQLAPANPIVRSGPAIAWIASGEYARARDVLATLGDDARANAVRGLLELRQGHPDIAAQRLTTAVTRDEKLYQAQALLALARLTLNQLPAAEAAARKAVALQPNSAQTQGTLALVLFFEHNTPEATEAADRAVQINPYSPFALLTRGRVLLAQSRLDDARNAFQQAQALAPDLPLVYTELGQVYLRLGLLPKAEAAFRQALTRQVVSPEAHAGLGVCLQLQGHAAEAIAEQQQALKLDPDNVGARVNLAAVYTEQGQLAAAEATLRLAGAERPEHGLYYARLAVIALYRQQLFTAQTYAQRAVALLPKSAIAHFVLGQVYQEQGRLLQAGQEYRQSCTLDPQYAPARYALGVVRGQLESGLDLTHPLGAVDAANQGSPGQALNIQNMQAPGTEDRIQAALEDPTVVRVASRAFGDLQLDGLLGEEHTGNAAISYLHESDDRRGVFGLAAAQDTTDGVRANADRTDQQFGISMGRKAADNPSGWFALAQGVRENLGEDLAAVSQSYDQHLRADRELPYFLLGGNLQSGDTHRTLALVSYERPFQNDLDSVSLANITEHFDGRHAEIRHDITWRNNLLSIGAGVGDRHEDIYSFLPSPLPPLIPNLQLFDHEEDTWEQAYLHDALKLSDRLSLIGEFRANRLTQSISTATIGLPLPPSITLADIPVGLPSLTASWQPTARDGLRLRARGVSGGIDDFQLLLPTEVFLFPTSDLPILKFGGRGQSYEAEYDHTFPDASLLRLGLLQQQLRRTENADYERLDSSTYQSFETRYERLLTPTLSGFASLAFIASAGVVDFGSGVMSPKDELSDTPRIKGELGFQYLDPRGWFVQPSYGFVGSRFQAHISGEPALQRARLDGYGVMNLRAGKRWGLRATLFVEAVNLFDQRYTVLSGTNEQLEPGRLLRAGLSLRL